MKCILMDERNFLNNNIAYSFLTCFLHKVNAHHLLVQIYCNHALILSSSGVTTRRSCSLKLDLFCVQVQVQVLSGQSCSNLVNVLVTNLLNEYHSLQPELTNQRAEMSKTSSLLNAVSTAPPHVSPSAPALFIHPSLSLSVSVEGSACAAAGAVGVRPSAAGPCFRPGSTGAAVQMQTVSAAPHHIRDGGQGTQTQRCQYTHKHVYQCHAWL